MIELFRCPPPPPNQAQQGLAHSNQLPAPRRRLRYASVRSPTSPSLASAGQWLFRGELAGRAACAKAASSPISRSVSCPQIPPSRSPSMSSLRSEHVKRRACPKADLTKSDQLHLIPPEPVPEAWQEAVVPLPAPANNAGGKSPRGVRSPTSELRPAVALQKNPSAFKKQKDCRLSDAWHTNDIPSIDDCEWSSPRSNEPPRKIRFLDRSRGLRESLNAQRPCPSDGACWRSGISEPAESTHSAMGQSAESEPTIDRRNSQDEVERFLAKELSGLRQQFFALDDPETPRLLESELLAPEPPA